MESNLKALYLSYDGMTDPLGQSQVIPYLAGLRKKGIQIHLVSFEKEERFKSGGEQVKALLDAEGITWNPLKYTPKPPILSTIFDLWTLWNYCRKLQQKEGFDIVHCRSYITAHVGFWMQQKFGTRFIFDMRAFYADERVDGGLWNLTNPVFSLVYKYFKFREKQFLKKADQAISLTYSAKEFIEQHFEVKQPVTVIPCCADLELFSPRPENIRQQYRQKLELSRDDYLLVYLGSVGTWYMPDEMMGFFKSLLKAKPNSRFLFLTTEPKEQVLSYAQKRQVPAERIIVFPSPRKEVPNWLAASDASVFFIKPVFSKKGSSPTKHGELLGCRVPLVCNGGVGDIDRIVEGSGTGVVIRNFSESDFETAVSRLFEINPQTDADKFDALAKKYYSLEEGVERYTRIYQNLS